MGFKQKSQSLSGGGQEGSRRTAAICKRDWGKQSILNLTSRLSQKRSSQTGNSGVGEMHLKGIEALGGKSFQEDSKVNT